MEKAKGMQGHRRLRFNRCLMSIGERWAPTCLPRTPQQALSQQHGLTWVFSRKRRDGIKGGPSVETAQIDPVETVAGLADYVAGEEGEGRAIATATAASRRRSSNGLSMCSAKPAAAVTR